jgi:hypothetical protein
MRSNGTAKAHLGSIYNEMCIERGRVPVVTMSALIGEPGEIRLYNFVSRDGNVSAQELLALCLLAKVRAPRLVLELGTYDGNTALQLAANIAHDARVVTVDLPPGAAMPEGGDTFDLGCIDSQHRGALRFAGTALEHKIRTVHGNTLELDFMRVCGGAKADMVFIDAGHSYECVRNDTEKSLGVLAPEGMLVWHDYGQSWPGVYNYLNEVADKLPLKSIAGTSLVTYCASA